MPCPYYGHNPGHPGCCVIVTEFSLAVNLPAMADMMNQQNQFVFQHLIQHTIRSDSEFVEIGKITAKLFFVDIFQIFRKPRYFPDNSPTDGFIQTF